MNNISQVQHENESETSIVAQENNRPRHTKKWLLVAYLVISILMLFLALVIRLVIPAFVDVFKSFGADLPVFTQYLIDMQNYWVVLPLIPTAFFLDILRRQKISRRYGITMFYFMIGFVIAMPVILGAVTIGMYLPIFRLGSTA